MNDKNNHIAILHSPNATQLPTTSTAIDLYTQKINKQLNNYKNPNMLKTKKK